MTQKSTNHTKVSVCSRYF